jgi:TonB-linked SusC/RagA family outer membrane protein
MKFKKAYIILLWAVCAVMPAFAQNARTLTGTVVDEQGEPIIGANIVAVDTKLGAATDFNGNFTLANLPTTAKQIRVTYLGYVTQTIDIAGKQTLKIELISSDTQLNDLVVVGYGTQKKAHLTGAIATIAPEDIKDLSGPSLSMSLRGLIPGVSVSGGDSRPGSMGRINIRQSSVFAVSTQGFTSYTGPLYVIDGFIADDETAFNNLDADMIENITILKDASAAVYGSRAANGVIIVTTKKGKLGAPKISYSGQFGYTDEIARVKYMDAYNYGVTYNTIKTADPTTVIDPRKDIFQADELEHMRGLNYNLLDKYWSSGLTQRHSINVGGATDKANYYAGISYYTQDGNIGKLSYDRWNFRAGMDTQIGKRVKAQLQVSGDYGNKESAYSKVGAGGGEGESDYQYLANHPYYIPEYVDKYPIAAYGLSNGGGNNEAYNFDVIQNLNNFNRSRPQNMTINTGLEYDFGGINILKGLKAKLTYSKSIATDEGNHYATDYTLYKFTTRGGSGNHLYTTSDLNLDENNITSIPISNGDFLRRTMNRADRYQMNFIATYNRTFGQHEVSGTFTIEKSESEMEDLEGEVSHPYPFTNYQSSGAASATKLADILATFSRTESASLAYAGRANWAYANKYLAEFLVRVDLSAKFHPDNYYGTFPSLSAGWVMSEEEWFRTKIDWLNFLKLRGSFGLTGRDNINAWQWLMTYGFQKDKGPVFGTDPSTSSGSHIEMPDAVPNRDAHWDKSYKSNLGVDANILNNKLSTGIDIYYEWNRDVFKTAQGSSDYPSTAGAQASAENYGKIDDWGIELSLNWRDKIGKDFKYNIGINFGYSDRKTLVDLWPARFAFNDLLPGQWANTAGSWGYECIGMFRNYQEIEEYFDKYQITNYCGLTKENVHPGMLIYNNIRGSQKEDGTYYGPNDPDDPRAGYVDGNDLVKINNRSNTWGFTTNAGVDWKGISLKFQLSASWGNNITGLPSGTTPGSITNGYTNVPAFWADNMFVYRDVLDAQDRVVVHQNLDAKYPNMAFGLNSNTSTFWLMNGLNLTLRNITLAYALPKKVAHFIGIESCRINITGQNMLTLYNPYPDHFYDPMAGSLSSYPNLRRFNVGLNVSF